MIQQDIFNEVAIRKYQPFFDGGQKFSLSEDFRPLVQLANRTRSLGYSPETCHITTCEKQGIHHLIADVVLYDKNQDTLIFSGYGRDRQNGLKFGCTVLNERGKLVIPLEEVFDYTEVSWVISDNDCTPSRSEVLTPKKKKFTFKSSSIYENEVAESYNDLLKQYEEYKRESYVDENLYVEIGCLTSLAPRALPYAESTSGHPFFFVLNTDANTMGMFHYDNNTDSYEPFGVFTGQGFSLIK